MELLSENEINTIIRGFGLTKASNWQIEKFSDKVIGNLGEHLKLSIEAVKDDEKEKTVLNLFIKCIPQFDKWKSEYLRETMFFTKEYKIFSELFKQFKNTDGPDKWRPTLIYMRKDLFIFEDVSQLGYKMPHHQNTMTFEELKATMIALAKFHAQSYIYEEKKGKELGRAYRIWEDFSEYLKEPEKTIFWRNTGRNAVIDFLKQYSKYRSKPNFCVTIEKAIVTLFDEVVDLMKPSPEYRNVVVHRDLWSNNIFLKTESNNAPHALIIDFQTVLYASPMLDVSSLIYFNTSRSVRDTFTKELINIYYDTLSKMLAEVNINVEVILPKTLVNKAYEVSLKFGITQAALIVPIVSMSSEKREQIFFNPERRVKANLESRSEEFIEVAQEDVSYYNRVLDLFDEIVERYVYPVSSED